MAARRVGELHERYVGVFGETVRSRHKRYLIRRIAWRLQANAEGGLSERGLGRAEELAGVAGACTTPRGGGTICKYTTYGNLSAARAICEIVV